MKAYCIVEKKLTTYEIEKLILNICMKLPNWITNFHEYCRD